MARVKLLEKNEVQPIAEEVYSKAEAGAGRVINLLKALAHSPKTMRDWNRMGVTILLKGELADDLRELAIIRVGHLAQAQYELIAHRNIGLQTGLKQEQIDDIGDWKNSPHFSEKELAVLQYTDEVALNIKASDDAFAKIKNFFNEREIVELTVAIGYYGMVCRILESLEVDLEIEPVGKLS